VTPGPLVRREVRAVATATLESRIDALERLLAAQGAELARLTALVDRTLGPRDDADRALLVEIARATQGHRFTSRSLWRHRLVDERLRQALEDTATGSVRELGHLLPRLGQAAGVRLLKIGTCRDGVIWHCEYGEYGTRG
jgi:hypothetical protein